ncbi:MAG: hypothetical protein AB8B79_22730, partial [Granulosicoccus sp.]
NDRWQAAVFTVLPVNAPSLVDGQLAGGPFSVEFEADLNAQEKGTLIEIGINIATPIENSRGTLLFLTGHSSSRFDTLRLLTEQQDLPLFIGDEYCRVLSQQRVTLSDSMRNGFRQLLDEAVGRDAVIRMTGHYDPDVVFSDVVAALRLS